MTELDRLTREINQLTREMVAEMGVEPARQFAQRSRELSKQYPLGDRRRIAMCLAADHIIEVARTYEADERLAKREKRLVRLWVAQVGVKHATEGAHRLLESAKEYPPGDWKGTSLRQIAEETLEVVQAYGAAGWTDHDNAKEERLNQLAREAGLGQNMVLEFVRQGAGEATP
ncbi:MAG TPA: hypothetical protein VKM93_03965 [Terriglobia bacterium]|nr:hypothetical protein [Terriglobia bacterium]